MKHYSTLIYTLHKLHITLSTLHTLYTTHYTLHTTHRYTLHTALYTLHYTRSPQHTTHDIHDIHYIDYIDYIHTTYTPTTHYTLHTLPTTLCILCTLYIPAMPPNWAGAMIFCSSGLWRSSMMTWARISATWVNSFTRSPIPNELYCSTTFTHITYIYIHTINIFQEKKR